ncbi:MAG: glutamate synthase large subunit [Peptostreptococcaceae bacterium]
MKNVGLYDSSFEKDSCGLGFVCNINGEKSNEIIKHGINILKKLTHRGGVLSDNKTGDGAGILTQIPDEFFRSILDLPKEYGVGNIFLPKEHSEILSIIEKILNEEGLTLVTFRDVEVEYDVLGRIAKESVPVIKQAFISNNSDKDLSLKLYIARRRIEIEVENSNIEGKDEFYITNLSDKVIVYKGLLLPNDIELFYKDLQNPLYKSALSVVHQRFSTNTFPKWKLAHPFRYVAHNGELNTIKGNRNSIKAREQVLSSDLLNSRVDEILPITSSNVSDSASLDNVLEFLVQNSKSLEESMMILVPEAWQNNEYMDEDKKSFYRYFANIMEPWDGPASIIFTNGVQIGATLDRNGLRPSRYTVTKDGLVILSSETGVIDLENKDILKKGRLEPGKIFMVDLEKNIILEDEEVKKCVYNKFNYKEIVENNKIDLGNELESTYDFDLHKYQVKFGYTKEELKEILYPMANDAKEAQGSMGYDVSLAVFSKRPKMLYDYFKQLFAQVTNPAIDPIRESMVMSLKTFIGSKGDLFKVEDLKFIEFESPVITNKQLLNLENNKEFKSEKMFITFTNSLEQGIKDVYKKVIESVKNGTEIIVLSDKCEGNPIPALLVSSYVNKNLIKDKLRDKVNLVVESGGVRDVMHFATLIGYGVDLVNPYVALETIKDLSIEKEDYILENNYLKACNDGLLKIISKMGISTIQSYRGAQIFEIVGLCSSVVDEYFGNTVSKLEGLDILEIENKVLERLKNTELEFGGEYGYRKNEENHLLNPLTVKLIHQGVKEDDYDKYKEFTKIIDSDKGTIRSSMELNTNQSISLDEVEPIEEIMHRFVIGAMSFGSLSKEVHENIAIAMNTIKGRSNCGEGGEDVSRFLDNRRSAIKQVASGRFGVTAKYLVNADEIQIKVAQGAKPGEGGSLPGKKVDEVVGKVRNSTPGIDLISPPPHHDIYSIEDLEQLIFDLKNVNPQAEVSVKLTAESGVGTISAGVVKARADKIVISGFDGGTGSAPKSSIKYTGLPFEIGLSETHQVLALNDLRSKVKLQVDGGLKTGKDVVISAILGAEEFGFSTMALISNGCIMCRRCNTNTCPVGICTQEPKLRNRYGGEVCHIINYFKFVATEVREIMASVGVKTINELVGKVELVNLTNDKLSLEKILYKVGNIYNTESQNHKIENVLDRTLIKLLNDDNKNEITITTENRSVGAMLGGYIEKEQINLDKEVIFDFVGSSGQSFGAFLTNNVRFNLCGEANDYVAKGLSGGTIVIKTPVDCDFESDKNIIAGNTILYGATSGKVYINGVVGERFAVRNSGALSVVEGVGNHALEYMTGGEVLILGQFGDNLCAGMSGGICYIYDEKNLLNEKLNNEDLIIDKIENSIYEERFKNYLNDYIDFTESKKAKFITENYEEQKNNIYVLIPKEYKKIIENK